MFSEMSALVSIPPAAVIGKVSRGDSGERGELRGILDAR